MKWFTLLQCKSEVDICGHVLEFILRSWWNNYWYLLSVLLMWVLTWVYYPCATCFIQLLILLYVQKQTWTLLAELGNFKDAQSAKHSWVLYTPTSGVVYHSDHSSTFAPMCVCVCVCMHMWKNGINGRYYVGIGRFYASMFMCPHLPHETVSLSNAELPNLTLVLDKVLL